MLGDYWSCVIKKLKWIYKKKMVKCCVHVWEYTVLVHSFTHSFHSSFVRTILRIFSKFIFHSIKWDSVTWPVTFNKSDKLFMDNPIIGKYELHNMILNRHTCWFNTTVPKLYLYAQQAHQRFRCRWKPHPL